VCREFKDHRDLKDVKVPREIRVILAYRVRRVLKAQQVFRVHKVLQDQLTYFMGPQTPPGPMVTTAIYSLKLITRI
jgi:hypothetical protein